MRNFLTNLTSFYWWISVVIVGILINVFSVYITRKFDARLSKTSSWWRERSEKQKAEYLRELAVLQSSQHEQVVAGFREIRFLLSMLFYLLVGVAFFSLGFFMHAGSQKHVGIWYWSFISVSIISLISGFVAGLIGFREADRASRQRRLIDESRHKNQP